MMIFMMSDIDRESLVSTKTNASLTYIFQIYQDTENIYPKVLILGTRTKFCFELAVYVDLKIRASLKPT